MTTEILWEQQIMNGSTFYTLHTHTDPTEGWKRLAKCLYLHQLKDPSILKFLVFKRTDLILIYVYYDSLWRDVFQIPFEVLNENN